MMKIGFVSMPFSGHLNPMTALGRRLQSRGHKVVFISMPDTEAAIRAANLDFVAFCEEEFPVGSIAKNWGPVAKLHGEDVLRYSLWNLTPGLLKAVLEHLPEKLAETGVEAPVLDTVYFFLELVPMRLGVPYIHIWNVLNINLSGATPPAFSIGRMRLALKPWPGTPRD